ncbi:MAG: 50S ribosomal protein L17 [Victivallales bacterium]|nr:50S ribosomal protein L17 [Victivallales bacterium]
MRHRKHTFKIGRTGAHRRSLLANQVCSLISSGEIRTTVTKAKETRRLAEKMVTLGKTGDLHRRRLAVARLRDKHAVALLFSEIAPRYTAREGGYTRIVRTGKRNGDGAEMCVLKWVDQEQGNTSSEPKKSKSAAKDAKKKVVAEDSHTTEEAAASSDVKETAEDEDSEDSREE